MEDIVLRRGVNPFMAERFLRLTNIPFSELRPHEAPEVMRLDFFSLFR